jgi:serine/threonine protein kinase
LIFSTQEVNRYVAELVSALVEIHAANIIHLDIKPGNIMVATSGQLKSGVSCVVYSSEFGWICLVVEVILVWQNILKDQLPKVNRKLARRFLFLVVFYHFSFWYIHTGST